MSTQLHRYRTTLNNLLHPTKVRAKIGFPTVYQQADELGGSFVRITKGLPEGAIANFSPSILRKDDKTIIAWRSQPEPFVFRPDMKYIYYNNTPTEVYIGNLLDDTTVFGGRKVRSAKHRLSLEDPRLFLTPDESLYCQLVTSSYASRWDTSNHTLVKSPKVCVGPIDTVGELIHAVYPNLGENLTPGKAEKNWCFFSDGEKLRLLYSTAPLVIKTPGEPDRVIDSSCLQAATGKHPTFNSTAPIKIDDSWLVFFHWKHMAMEALDAKPHLVYHLGAYLLNEDLTAIEACTTEALFSGSTNDELVTWTDCLGNPISKQPACILPFGCYVENGELVMALGVNDSFMGIFRTDLANILSELETVPAS